MIITVSKTLQSQKVSSSSYGQQKDLNDFIITQSRYNIEAYISQSHALTQNTISTLFLSKCITMITDIISLSAQLQSWLNYGSHHICYDVVTQL